MPPVGRPEALRATSWGVPTAVVEMAVVVLAPAVTVPELGVAAMVKSPGGGGGVPALNRASPDAQYMVLGKDPVKLWLPGALRSW